MTDRQDKERERKDDKQRREESERRAGDLREAWRRRHPTREEQDKDRWPTKRPPT